MRRALAGLALGLALAAGPAQAATDTVTLTTPDGAQHDCRLDSPGASFEARLVADGWTEQYTIEGALLSGATIVILCQPQP